jgi:hypothetical protein
MANTPVYEWSVNILLNLLLSTLLRIPNSLHQLTQNQSHILVIVGLSKPTDRRLILYLSQGRGILVCLEITYLSTSQLLDVSVYCYQPLRTKTAMFTLQFYN